MRCRSSAFALVAALALSTPAFSQDARVEAMAREDFQCAVWVSVIAATPMAQDPEIQTGFNVALGFFVGRYEGLTGRGIDANWDAEAAEEVVLNLERFAGICGDRMDAFGLRLQNLGGQMVDYSERGRRK